MIKIERTKLICEKNTEKKRVARNSIVSIDNTVNDIPLSVASGVS